MSAVSTKKNTVILLIGPKGSGKTHIGSRLERTMEYVHFVRVESIFLRLQNTHKEADMGTLAELCYQETAEEVQTCLQPPQPQMAKSIAVLELTGVAPQLPALLETLQKRHEVKFAKVVSSADICLERVRGRDAAAQIPVSEERVLEINRLAAAVEYPWDLIVDNGTFRTDAEIIDLFADLL